MFGNRYMKRKITINKNIKGPINGRLTIPMKLLKEIGISESDREVIISVENNKLIIEKFGDKNIELPGKINVEITQDERDYLF